MSMYYLKHGNDTSNSVEAVSINAAWNYFAAMKKLTVESLKDMGYSVAKKNLS